MAEMNSEDKATLLGVLALFTTIFLVVAMAFGYATYKVHHHTKTVKIEVEARVVNP